MSPRITAPIRRALRVGAVLILICTNCDRAAPAADDAGARVLELAHDTIELPAGVTLVEIGVRRSAPGEFEPPRAEARQGDVVRFTARDRASHAIVFDGTALDVAVRDYLERSAQLRSPPLITDGAAWVITLDGAPAGNYPFRCVTHNATGLLQVRAAQ